MLFVISECADGGACHSHDARHYSLFKHSLLANVMAGIQPTVNVVMCIASCYGFHW